PPLTASSSLLLSRTSSCCSTASATTEIYTLSLHDALPISGGSWTAGATAPTEIELPGLLTARIVPGAPAAQMQETLDVARAALRSEEHTSELQSRENLVCRLLLEKKKKK